MEKVKVEQTAWVLDAKEEEQLREILMAGKKLLIDGAPRVAIRDGSVFVSGIYREELIKTADYMIGQLEQDDST